MHYGASSRLFENADKLRKTMTEPEQVLWEYLRTKPEGFKFRRQHPIGIYILDFYCHELRFSIEIDGGYHLSKEQKEKDSERTAYLNDLGINEIRFKNEEVLKDVDLVVEEIRSFY